jgi:hypothetical protein
MSPEQKETYKTNKIRDLIQLKANGIGSSESVLANINNDKILDLKIDADDLDNDLLNHENAE